MVLKNKSMRRIIIIMLLLFTIKSWSQNDSLKFSHTFNEYKTMLNSCLNYYEDSISQGNICFMVEVYIADFDTANQTLKIIQDFSWYNPTGITFTPTHIIRFNNRIYLVRFGNKISKEIIRKLNFSMITKDTIVSLEKTGKIYAKKNNNPTGSSQSFVFEVHQNIIKRRWYEQSEMAPPDDRVLDFTYDGSLMKYEDYLNNKLQEYR
jgi:hypothetical protein